MKKNRHILLKGFIMFIMATFTFTSAFAQEEKEEKKVIKVKVMADEDGNISIDTSFVLDEDFDGDWKTLIEDEELLEKLENIEIDLNLDEDGNVYLIKAPPTAKKGYFYSVESNEDGEVFVEVESETEGNDHVWVSKVDGDTTMTLVVKTADCKHKGHDGEHKMVISKEVDVNVEEVDGESVVTYTIKMDGEEGEHQDVMIWHGEDGEEFSHEVIMEKMKGDSCKVVVYTTGGDGEAVGVTKKKEVIIIMDEKHDCDHDHDKDKKKKKKKKDDD